jgi:hypothetical protein
VNQDAEIVAEALEENLVDLCREVSARTEEPNLRLTIENVLSTLERLW